jgi:type IV pilus assembly protein PilC
MATVTASTEKKIKEINYSWEGKDKYGKQLKGEMRAAGTVIVTSTLRRQGIKVTKIEKMQSNGRIIEKDITLFTRQLATMMKSGVPLLQAFDIIGKGHSNRALSKLLMDIKADVETGSNLTDAFRKYPLYFDALYCNLVGAGEAAGILDTILDRLATYKEKIQAIKGKIKSALFYPISIIVVAFVITAIIMIFVIPAFKDLFEGFGADLPAPTLFVMAISDFFVAYWWAIFGIVGGGIYAFFYTWKRSIPMQRIIDRIALKIPFISQHSREHPYSKRSTIPKWIKHAFTSTQLSDTTFSPRQMLCFFTSSS